MNDWRSQFGAVPPDSNTAIKEPPWWDKFGTLGDTLGGITVFLTAVTGLFFVVTRCKVKRK